MKVPRGMNPYTGQLGPDRKRVPGDNCPADNQPKEDEPHLVPDIFEQVRTKLHEIFGGEG